MNAIEQKNSLALKNAKSKVEQPEVWCNTHKRPAELCKVRGGIMLPCRVVDLRGIMEIEYEE